MKNSKTKGFLGFLGFLGIGGLLSGNFFMAPFLFFFAFFLFFRSEQEK